MKKNDNIKYRRIDSIGVERYTLNGRTHREDGPAYINDTVKEWWIHGRKHREYGPAIEYTDGDWVWYKNGKKHREDGPAEKFSDELLWWLNGKEYTSFDSWLKALNVSESTKLMLALKYK